MATGLNGYVKGSPEERKYILDNFQVGTGGKLQYVGQGAAPLLDSGAQRFARRYGSAYQPVASQPTTSFDMGSGEGSGLDLSGLLQSFGGGGKTAVQKNFLGQANTPIARNDPSSYYAQYTPGGQEALLNQYFREALTGKDRYGASGNPVAQTLFSLAQGKLPQPLTDLLTQQTNDQFGKLGARFGTDLATATSRGLGQASSQQALAAQGLLSNLGSTTSGMELQANQNALDRSLKQSESGLDRALQEWMTKQGNDPTMAIIKMLLGGAFNVGG